MRPPTEPFNHPECKDTRAQAPGRENRTCSCALMSVMGQMGTQIKMRITRQIHPWQSSCSQASGLQDSQICVYLSNGKTYKTPPQRAPRHRSCSGQRPHSLPSPQTCPHPRLQLLMEFAIRFKEDSNLKNSYRSPIDRGSGISMHREDSPCHLGSSGSIQAFTVSRLRALDSRGCLPRRFELDSCRCLYSGLKEEENE